MKTLPFRKSEIQKSIELFVSHCVLSGCLSTSLQQIFTDQRLPYTSGGSVRGVYLKHYEWKSLVGATVCGDGSDKLDAAWSILRTSTSAFLKQLRYVVVSSLRGAAVLACYEAVSLVTMSGEKVYCFRQSSRQTDRSCWMIGCECVINWGD